MNSGIALVGRFGRFPVPRVCRLIFYYGWTFVGAASYHSSPSDAEMPKTVYFVCNRTK